MKTFTIKMSKQRSSSSIIEKTIQYTTGTLEGLLENYRYTLEESSIYWGQERGYKKINTNPKEIESLVINLNRAAYNSAIDGYSVRRYELVSNEQPNQA